MCGSGSGSKGCASLGVAAGVRSPARICADVILPELGSSAGGGNEEFSAVGMSSNGTDGMLLLRFGYVNGGLFAGTGGILISGGSS